MPPKTPLMLRSAPRARLEARTAAMQPIFRIASFAGATSRSVTHHAVERAIERAYDDRPVHTALPSGPLICCQFCSTNLTTFSGIGT